MPNVFVSGGDLENVIDEADVESEDMAAFIKRITPGHVLAYATGANQTPAAGFEDHPKITFTHDASKFMPAANTCSYELILFVNSETISSKFHKHMVRALMNGVVFSTI